MNNGVRIGFIDSGVGAIFFAQEMYQQLRTANPSGLPDIELVHVLDQANLPYGSKTKEEISILTKALIEKAVDLGLKTIFIACNTMCAAGSIDFEKYKPVKIITLLERTAEYIYQEAKKYGRSPNISVVSTKYTADNGSYKKALEAIQKREGFFKSLNISLISMPNWVCYGERYASISNKQLVGDIEFEIEQEIQKNPLFGKSDIAALCCTHYIPLAKIASAVFLKRGSSAEVITQPRIFAQELANIIQTQNNQERARDSLTARAITTGKNKAGLRNLMKRLYKGTKESKIVIE